VALVNRPIPPMPRQADLEALLAMLSQPPAAAAA
jgi:hypothetical protein